MFMPRSVFTFVVLFLITFSCSCIRSHEEAHITFEISNKGLDFVKDLLVEEAESSLVPLELPKIENSVKIPVLGTVKMTLSDITIEKIHVSSSTVQTGDSGIVISVSGATANMSMNWKYSYTNWFFTVSDKGSATVQVDGLEIGLTLSLKTVEGSLKLSLLDCGCYVNYISINLDGGASWLYQGLVDAFGDKLSSAVENAVPQKLKDAIGNLDSLLQSLPKEVPVTNVAQLNVTFVDDPELSASSFDLQIDGLFSPKHKAALAYHYNRLLLASSSCKEADKMVKISLHEDVLNSASSVYFKAGKMLWTVDKLPEQSLLNTAGWRFIIPQLYRKYPNCDMNLNLSLSSPPIIKVENEQIRAKVPLDMVIDVLDGEEVIPVACISMVITGSVYAEISGDTLAGIAKLNDFNISLTWSNIGSLHIHLIQTLVSTTLRAVLLPYINLKFSEGFKIPAFHGYELQDAQLLCKDSWIVICSDVASLDTVQSRLVALY